MRISFYTFMLLYSVVVHATDINMKTITEQDKSAYLLEIGDFPFQSEAQTLQQELSQTLQRPIVIHHPNDKSPYTLQIGPIEDHAVALELQQKVSDLMHQKSDNISTQAKGKIWNLRNADIRAVIAEVSRVLKKNFVVDPRVQGKISIVSATPISDKELYQVFLSMLQVSGYSAIPSGEIIKIIPNIEARTTSPDLLGKLKSPPRGDDMVVQVVPVKHVPAEHLVPVLRPLMPQWSNVSAYTPSNMLILSGRSNNIKQMVDIIGQVDTSSANGVDMVILHHALAMDVVNTLKDLVKSQPGTGVQAQTVLAADDRNNAILISGSKTERIRLRLLISQLDREGPGGSGNSNTKVIYLNYLRAEDLVPILAGIAQASFSGTVGTTIGTITRPALDSTNPASSMANGTSSTPAATPNTINPAATPNTVGVSTQNEGGTKPTVQIIGEPNTNSIIINAPITLIRTLQSVVSQLDIKPAQILIEALVTEINESDFNSLGIDWGSVQSSALSNTTFRPGFAIINSQTAFSRFQAQIYALARVRKANILSTPSVVVLDNRQAKILIGKQVSVATSSYPNNANATTTASPYTTFDRVNVALHLYVRPQITRGQGIQMQIDQGNDTIDPASILDASTNPVFNISAIVTSVHVDSGNIIVLGGLAQDSLGNDNTGLPVLGNIPGVGRLFQHNIRNREKKILMVFIRPLILKTESDSLQVTGSKYQDIREHQLDSLRTQEIFEENDKDVVLPTPNAAPLPKPFCNVPTMTKPKISTTK